jgi:folylpolyglutamate synthase/dihydropteroate synthase
VSPAGSVELNRPSASQTFRLRTDDSDYGIAKISLLGPHQRLNALVATVAAERFLRRVDPSAILEGLAGATWPGRLELAGDSPTIILDGAHNNHSAAVLADSIRELVPESLPATLVLGSLRGKDIGAILRQLEPIAGRYWITASQHPRAVPVDGLSRQVRARSKKPINQAATPAQALDRAKQESGSTGLIVVTGSLSVVAEAREHLGLPLTLP